MRKYQVINIIDEYAIMINYGAKDSAKVGEEIRVFKKGEEIKDLNGNSLGNIEIVKDELEVYQVHEKFSICKKIRTEKKSPFDMINLYNKTVEVDKKLNINVEEISNLEYETTEVITIGDLVRIIK